jgi:hypothetical protein
MFEIFGIKMTISAYVILFVICQFINVALNTAKTIIMHKEEKISSSIINAITYGFYAIIVVMTASALPLWITIIITILTNLIGVYGSMWLLDRFKKDSLWEIVATTDRENLEEIREYLNVCEIAHNYNLVDNYKNSKVVFRIYSENQKQSEEIKYILDKVGAKRIVHEERVKL